MLLFGGGEGSQRSNVSHTCHGEKQSKGDGLRNDFADQ